MKNYNGNGSKPLFKAVVNEAIPFSTSSEEGLLGSVIIDPEAYILVSDIVATDDFYHDAHRNLYKVIESLVERDMAADVISIGDELERLGIQLDPDNGNGFFLSRLVNRTPTSGNATTYAQTIADCAVRRRLMFGAGQISASAQSDTAEEALSTAENVIFTISQKRNANAVQTAKDIGARRLEHLFKVHEHPMDLMGISTGFRDLDRIYEGLQRQLLHILAGRPGMGKSTLALQMAWAAAKAGKRVVIFSLEMSADQLVDRMAVQLAGVPLIPALKGKLNKEELERIALKYQEIMELPLEVDDSSGLSMAQLRNRCLLLAAKHGIDLVIVDYLTELHMVKPDGKSYGNKVDEYTDIAEALKGLAKRLNIPVLALAQLSRAVEGRNNKVPQLSDLRESGGIEQAADVVSFIYRDDYYNPNTERPGQADIIIAKNRFGSCGEVALAWKGELTRFANLEVTG